MQGARGLKRPVGCEFLFNASKRAKIGIRTSQVCDTREIQIRKKRLTISDLNQALRDKDLVSVSQWRFVQHLADLRNLCDHAREREPQKGDIGDLVAGTDKILKSIY